MAEAPRNRLPSGYDEDFVDAVEDELLCLICHLALREPDLTRCGHRFCKECLEEHFRRCDFNSLRGLVSFSLTSECLSQGPVFTLGTSLSLSTRKRESIERLECEH